MGRGNILIAGGDAAIRTLINQTLARADYSPRATSNAATLWNWIAEGEGDVVITDVMSNENALDLIPRIKKIRPEIPIIVMSIHNTFMAAIAAAKRGAFDYLPKPLDVKELITVVGRALHEPRTAASSMPAEAEVENLFLFGRSAPMQDVYRIMARLVRTDSTALITEEPGTGRRIRRLNCSAVSVLVSRVLAVLPGRTEKRRGQRFRVEVLVRRHPLSGRRWLRDA
jgi:two-component system, NtrC family, nitrogen regulation response regulator GlnG